MPRKTIIIFIVVFIAVGALGYGGYFLYNKYTETSGSNTTSPGTSGYQQFNPFGTGGATATNTPPTTTTPKGEQTAPAGGTVGEVTVYKLNKLTDFAIAGATFFQDTRALPQLEGTKVDPKVPKTELVPSLRYVERATGHVFERYLDTGVVGEISNSTIPNIYETFFDSKAQSIMYRYLETDKTISSFLATLGAAKGDFLPSNIIDISLSPDKTKFFYLTKTSSGVTGTSVAFGQAKRNQFFSSSYDEWLSQWVTTNSIFLTTKASGQADGYLYTLNTTNGALKKIFGPVAGLTTLANKDGSLVLYSASSTGSPSLGLLDVAHHSTRDLGLTGLPEKCVWSADNTNIFCAIPNTLDAGQYPDAWYQGLTSFDDHFIEINTKTFAITKIDSTSNSTSVDATHLFLDDKEVKLFFTNKKDSTLWGLDLK
jgi:hypothetical protein